MRLYHDRTEAGRDLAQRLMAHKIIDPMLFALLRGGVPVASMISRMMGLSFEVLITRQISYPGHPEWALGVMTEDGNPLLTKEINYADPRILEVINYERQEQKRMRELYRQGGAVPKVEGRNVVLIDDGLETSDTALSAGKFLKEHGSKTVTLAVAVAPFYEGELLARYIDRIVCPHHIQGLKSIRECFQEFRNVSDHEVLGLLGRDTDMINIS